VRGKGITYDTGFFRSSSTASTREVFDPEVVRRELRVIREDLHCNAVRVTGGDPDRLETAARHAAEAGLEVWLSPFTCDLTTDELDVLGDCAERAERLRQQGAGVVLLTGAELSLFTVGFLPGDSLNDRLGLLRAPQRLREPLAEVPARINDFLAMAVEVVGERFGGKLSYASLPFEGVDWTPFDVISTDAGSRSIELADRFRDDIRAFVAQATGQGKPAAITEFGCTTHRGAADLGGRGDTIVDWGDDGRPLHLQGTFTRDEAEQATYLRELLDVFDAEGVDTAMVNTFARYDLPHRSDPHQDFDMASYGVVKVVENRFGHTYPDMAWEPKAAFTASPTTTAADRVRAASQGPRMTAELTSGATSGSSRGERPDEPDLGRGDQGSDRPWRAVVEAHSLVAEFMQHLTGRFAGPGALSKRSDDSRHRRSRVRGGMRDREGTEMNQRTDRLGLLVDQLDRAREIAQARLDGQRRGVPVGAGARRLVDPPPRRSLDAQGVRPRRVGA
jgi:hypothetical protein